MSFTVPSYKEQEWGGWKPLFLSEVNQFLLTKETVTDSWRIDTSLWATGDAGLNWNSDLVKTVLIWSVTEFSQGQHKDITEIWMLKVNQKAPGKMRCKFIMETIEFFKSKTKKKETDRVFPNPESTQWNSMICRQGKVLFIEKFWQAFCWQLWKPSPAPHHEEVTCHSGAISFVKQLNFKIILSYTLIPR